MSLTAGTYTFRSGNFTVELRLKERHIREARRRVRCGDLHAVHGQPGSYLLRPFLRISVGETQIVGDNRWPGRRKPMRYPVFPLATNLVSIADEQAVTRNVMSPPRILFHQTEQALLFEVSQGTRLRTVALDDFRSVASQLAEWSRDAMADVFAASSRPEHIAAWIDDGRVPREMFSPIGTSPEYEGLIWEYRYWEDLTQVWVTSAQQARLREAFEDGTERWEYWLIGDVCLGQLGNILVFYASLPRFCQFLREVEARHAVGDHSFDFQLTPRKSCRTRLRGKLVWIELEGEQFWCTRKYLRLLRRGLALDTLALMRRIVPEHDWSEMEQALLEGLEIPDRA